MIGFKAADRTHGVLQQHDFGNQAIVAEAVCEIADSVRDAVASGLAGNSNNVSLRECGHQPLIFLRAGVRRVRDIGFNRRVMLGKHAAAFFDIIDDIVLRLPVHKGVK